MVKNNVREDFPWYDMILTYMWHTSHSYKKYDAYIFIQYNLYIIFQGGERHGQQ